jgi:hypothetical protein
MPNIIDHSFSIIDFYLSFPNRLRKSSGFMLTKLANSQNEYFPLIGRSLPSAIHPYLIAEDEVIE